MFDLIIKNGQIIDGSGVGSFVADIGIKNQVILKIGKDLIDENCSIIDASNLVVCPGFIDIHGNSDWTLFINNKGESKIRQGVTTEVQGNCGFSAAPVTTKHRQDLLSYLANTAILDDKAKDKWKWKSQADFMEKEILANGIPFNIAPLVGHGTIKVGVMGFEDREPTAEEINEMKILLKTELERGLFGLSSGLEYAPGFQTKHNELVELCKLVKEFDGVYSTHMRNEGRDLLQSVSDSIEVAKESGVSLLITHLKASYRPNWGKSEESLQLIDNAYAEGINVDFDVYPYIAFGSGLIDLIPPWAKVNGAEQLSIDLQENHFKERVIKDMGIEHADWENPMINNRWEDVIIALLKTTQNQKYEGKNLAQIATDMNISPYEAVTQLLIDEKGGVKSIYFAMCDEDLNRFMKHPRAMLSSDGRAVAPYGELSRGAVHPRYYGTFPRILGKYARDKKIFSLEEAIKKCTHLPALKMKIKKRGLLKEGYYADITIFDKENVIDISTFDNSHQYSKGIKHVIVNGKPVIHNYDHTGILPGKVLNKNVQ